MTAVTQLVSLLPESVIQAVSRSGGADAIQKSAVLVSTALAGHSRFTELVQALTDAQGPCCKDPQGECWTRAPSVVEVCCDLGRVLPSLRGGCAAA